MIPSLPCSRSTATATVNGKSETLLTNAQCKTLYTYSGESAAGQTNGEGVAGIWFVFTPNLK